MLTSNGQWVLGKLCISTAGVSVSREDGSGIANLKSPGLTLRIVYSIIQNRLYTQTATSTRHVLNFFLIVTGRKVWPLNDWVPDQY